MDTNTKKRYLSQMLANAEQLEQGAKDLDLKVEHIRTYKIYLLEEYTKALVEEEESANE